MTHLDLFSGIGGFALAALWNGFETVGFSEIDPYASAILKKHWPTVPNYGDIKNVTQKAIGRSVELVTGGFPCQPFSLAGKRKGKADHRHLWPEMLRVIADTRPAWVIGENVPGIVTMELDACLTDLESQGYSCQAIIIPACATDAWHRRDRVWIVANSVSNLSRIIRRRKTESKKTTRHTPRSSSDSESLADGQGDGPEGRSWQNREQVRRIVKKSGVDTDGICASPADANGKSPQWTSIARQECLTWPTEPDVGRVAHGLPARLDRIKCLGNSIVPQVASEIMRCIKEITYE